jgi:hypothetical protein
VRAGSPAPTGLTHRRVLVLAAITSAPLAALSAVGGLMASRVEVPFLNHTGLHIQFLLSMSMLIAADAVVQKWLPPSVEEFLSRDLVASRASPAVQAA